MSIGLARDAVSCPSYCAACWIRRFCEAVTGIRKSLSIRRDGFLVGLAMMVCTNGEWEKRPTSADS
jgi:hypothetical protein